MEIWVDSYIEFIIVKPKLITHTKEWKEAEAEMLIEQKQNPFHGPYGEYLAKQQVK